LILRSPEQSFAVLREQEIRATGTVRACAKRIGAAAGGTVYATHHDVLRKT